MMLILTWRRDGSRHRGVFAGRDEAAGRGHLTKGFWYKTREGACRSRAVPTWPADASGGS